MLPCRRKAVSAPAYGTLLSQFVSRAATAVQCGALTMVADTERSMHAVIFEVEAKEGRAQRYFDLAAQLRPGLEKLDDFISVERCETINIKGTHAARPCWRDEQPAQ